jgi:hypothetical protein
VPDCADRLLRCSQHKSACWGQKGMHAICEIGKELGLKDPFEMSPPVHLRYSTDLKQLPQAAE